MGKGKHVRNRSMKVLHKKRLRSKKYKHSKWKLNYPEIFKTIGRFPYIVRKDDKRYN
ncbi:hypothetical protein LCGC14_1841420 [marine sediment metagenome]|uniref:Uncharacterized protein n=1 Tax=marine sediment metagenome TaxID=412755 RepID=A0A0F9H1A0_9ZZZZ